MSTLANIRTKVRRITGRPSSQQITDGQIDEYINTFYIYDMPATLRLFTQETTFEFMTVANVDIYDMRSQLVYTRTNPITGLEDFVPAADYYITVSPPAYIAGYQSFWSQSREQFFRTYPALATVSTQIQGNGTPGPYTFTFASTPIQQRSITVGAIDDTGDTVNCIDVPINRTTGNWKIINTNTNVTGVVNYLTGSVTVTFPNNIPSGSKITFSAVPYQPSRPQALLFYDNIFTLRPIPDSNYLVKVNAFKRPTTLIDSDDYPELKQWWQYLAYGASLKIFQDSQDPEGEANATPEFKRQERMVLRRTLIERTQQRTSTIYTEMSSFPYGNQQGQF
jgi:hypothetical protein